MSKPIYIEPSEIVSISEKTLSLTECDIALDIFKAYMKSLEREELPETETAVKAYMTIGTIFLAGKIHGIRSERERNTRRKKKVLSSCSKSRAERTANIIKLLEEYKIIPAEQEQNTDQVN